MKGWKSNGMPSKKTVSVPCRKGKNKVCYPNKNDVDYKNRLIEKYIASKKENMTESE